MGKIFDEFGTMIYAGVGRKSKQVREMIENNSAYVLDDEGQLVMYVQATEPNLSTSEEHLEEQIRKLKIDAQNIGQSIGLGLDGVEIRRNTSNGQIIAHLKQISMAYVAGLDSHQAAHLMQTISMMMLNQNITVFEHDELIRNLHTLIDSLRAPSTGSALLNRESNILREESVNCIPGSPTTKVYDELWIHGFLPPQRDPCRPSVQLLNENEGHDVYGEGRIWMDPALVAGPSFVCQNLEDASNLVTFKQGRHGTIRIFLPYESSFNQQQFLDHQDINMMLDRRETPCHDIDPNHEPWQHCLDRFIQACSFVKNRFRHDLRLFIHRGGDKTKEVIL
ncbi:MAG: hypothetical protein VW230_07025 [Candidatus Poseidoniales archaeon]